MSLHLRVVSRLYTNSYIYRVYVLMYTALQTNVHNPIDSLNIEDIYEWKILFRL